LFSIDASTQLKPVHDRKSVDAITLCSLAIRVGQLYPFCMSIPVEQLTEEMLALPADARAILADRLVESLDPLTDDEVRSMWTAEAIRRRDEVRSGAVDTIPSDVVEAHVRSLVGK